MESGGFEIGGTAALVPPYGFFDAGSGSGYFHYPTPYGAAVVVWAERSGLDETA